MGDIADMMFDGTLCSTCGVYIGAPDGYPRTCRSCVDDERRVRKQLNCGICPPHKGDNAQHRGKHGVTKPKYKNHRSRNVGT